MNIKILSTLLLIIVIVSVNAGWPIKKDLTLKQISGKWEGSFTIPFINVFPEDGLPVQAICREEASKECQKTIPDAFDTFIIDADANKFSTGLVTDPMTTDKESSAELYPECAADGIFLKLGEFSSLQTIISYEDGKLTEEYGETMTSCIEFDVEVRYDTVVAKIRQVLDVDILYENFLGRPPYICPAEKDSIFGKYDEEHDDIFGGKHDDWPFSAVNSLQNKYDDVFRSFLKKKKETECFFEFTETGFIGRYDFNYELTCVDGPCLELANTKWP